MHIVPNQCILCPDTSCSKTYILGSLIFVFNHILNHESISIYVWKTGYIIYCLCFFFNQNGHWCLNVVMFRVYATLFILKAGKLIETNDIRYILHSAETSVANVIRHDHERNISHWFTCPLWCGVNVWIDVRTPSIKILCHNKANSNDVECGDCCSQCIRFLNAC